MAGSLLTVPFPSAGWAVPSSSISAGRYLLRFARTEADLDRVIRLRQEAPHRDDRSPAGEDDFDRRGHHLMIEERETRTAVAAYRMQTAEMAAEAGFASADLFDLDGLPQAVLDAAVEVGVAWVAREHRNPRVLDLLWRGLANYLTWNRKTVVFGSCGVPIQDQALALALHRHLTQLGAQHESLQVDPLRWAACRAPIQVPFRDHRLPDLFQSYLSVGAKILGPPAVHEAAGTVNWLILLDINRLDSATYRSYFG